MAPVKAMDELPMRVQRSATSISSSAWAEAWNSTVAFTTYMSPSSSSIDST
jgi:hypothetical protein